MQPHLKAAFTLKIYAFNKSSCYIYIIPTEWSFVNYFLILGDDAGIVPYGNTKNIQLIQKPCEKTQESGKLF